MSGYLHRSTRAATRIIVSDTQFKILVTFRMELKFRLITAKITTVAATKHHPGALVWRVRRLKTFGARPRSAIPSSRKPSSKTEQYGEGGVCGVGGG